MRGEPYQPVRRSLGEGASLPRGQGNYYYGARYYDPKISVWLSVDPITQKYSSLLLHTFT